MTWFKVSDGFYTSKKVLSIPRTCRLAAVGLWAMAGNWSGRELTDGRVPSFVLAELGATPRLRRALIDARLWIDHGSDGIEFHSWADYQPTRAEVEADRAKAAERQRTWRQRHKGETRDDGVSNGVTDGVTNGVSAGAPTRPDPTRPDLPSTPVEGTREALSPFCSKHPTGTDEPCRACGTARKAYEVAEKAERSKPSPTPFTVMPGTICFDGLHTLLSDGTCTRCEYRAEVA